MYTYETAHREVDLIESKPVYGSKPGVKTLFEARQDMSTSHHVRMFLYTGHFKLFSQNSRIAAAVAAKEKEICGTQLSDCSRTLSRESLIEVKPLRSISVKWNHSGLRGVSWPRPKKQHQVHLISRHLPSQSAVHEESSYM